MAARSAAVSAAGTGQGIRPISGAKDGAGTCGGGRGSRPSASSSRSDRSTIAVSARGASAGRTRWVACTSRTTTPSQRGRPPSAACARPVIPSGSHSPARNAAASARATPARVWRGHVIGRCPAARPDCSCRACADLRRRRSEAHAMRCVVTPVPPGGAPERPAHAGRLGTRRRTLPRYSSRGAGLRPHVSFARCCFGSGSWSAWPSCCAAAVPGDARRLPPGRSRRARSPPTPPHRSSRWPRRRGTRRPVRAARAHT